MKFKKIPKTELSASRIALGTWPFSGDIWGHVEETTCIETIQAALEAGVNFIDTAPIYGFGRAEEVVGKALKGKRDRAILATKCGLLKEGKSIVRNLTPASIRKELEESLRRLQTGAIDLYQLHWPDPNTNIEETMEEVHKFLKEGKIKAVGVCNFDLDLLKKTVPLAPISTIQNEYSLLRRGVEHDILPFCEKEGIGFLAYGPLAGGILSGKYAKEPNLAPSDPRRFFYRYYKGDAFHTAEKIVDELKTLAEVHHTVPLDVALAWITSHPAVVSAIVGAKTPDQIRIDAKAADLEIPNLKDHPFCKLSP